MLDRTFITVLHRNTTRRSRFAHQNLPDQRQARCGLAETAVPTDLRKQRFESPPTPPSYFNNIILLVSRYCPAES